METIQFNNGTMNIIGNLIQINTPKEIFEYNYQVLVEGQPDLDAVESRKQLQRENIPVGSTRRHLFPKSLYRKWGGGE